MSKMFIGFPEARLTSEPGGGTEIKKALWGDWCEVLAADNDYRKIKCRNAEGWVHKNKLQDNQLLEINFVDVGQGDGCFIVTPQDKFILVDAGEGQNMFHFLNWRFNLRQNEFVVPIEHLIISHSDTDHYKGFRYIVDSSRFKIDHIHHNGIIERNASKVLGASKDGYLTDLKPTRAEALQLLSVDANRGKKLYPNLLYDALTKHGVPEMSMLEKGMRLQGYGPGDEVFFNILGPVTETKDGKKVLKYFNANDGEAKNGHSVIIQLVIDKVKILLGGDLNDASEEYLAQHYTGYNPKTVSDANRADMIAKGREVFESDILKSCHHGSHKFVDDFLSFFNPIATVISSGDNETHTHPRPDTLGAIGKHSRGKRPLIFSTELARSAKDRQEITDKDYANIYLLTQKRKTATAEEKVLIDRELEQLKYKLERTIAVYGMISIRTDGKKVIIAQKKEESGAGFIIYELHPDAQGKLYFKP